MIEQKTFLFVGGTRDGETEQLREPQFIMRYPVMPLAKFNPDELDTAGRVSPVVPAYKVESYHLERVRTKGETEFYFYRHESLSLDEVFLRLLSCYKPRES